MDYNEAPRAELIAELKAWEKKSAAKIAEKLKSAKTELDIERLRIEKLVMDMESIVNQNSKRKSQEQVDNIKKWMEENPIASFGIYVPSLFGIGKHEIPFDIDYHYRKLQEAIKKEERQCL